LIAAADGSALGNPGPAGWGWYIDEDRWACGGWPRGTNNMGELTAVLDLLQQTADLPDELHVYCDSTYVINSVTKWMPGWKRKNWRKGDGKPVQNVEIMKALDAALQGRHVRFEWVKGHAGHELNEAADRLANGAATAYSQGKQPDPGPGMGALSAVEKAAVEDSHAGYRPTPKPEPEADLFSLLEEDAPSDEERVIALERELLSDAVRADPAAVAALLHPAWSEIGRSGRLWQRDELLAEITPLAEPVSLDVVSVNRIADEVILLVWRAVADDRTTLRSSLWVRDGGDWRQRFQHGTRES